MKKRLLFCSIAGLLASCQQETDIQPTSASLTNEVAGTYRTNVYLDPSTVAMPSDQMPYAVLKPESDSSVILTYITLYPAEASQVIEHVLLSRQADGIQLRLSNKTIGSLQTDRIFTNNGMEKQGQLLRLTGQKALEFVGSK